MKKLLVLTAVATMMLGSMGCRCLEWCRRGEMCAPYGASAPCGDACGVPGAAPACTSCGPGGPVVPGPEGYSPAPMQ